MISQEIYESKKNNQFSNSTSAITVMPDIFGITSYAKATMEKFSEIFQQPTYMFDYFYCLTNTPSKFSPEESNLAFELMQKMRGEDFVSAFKSALQQIQQSNPSIQSFTVVGFCFAGRLAYLTAVERSVNTIISFYGAGAHTPNYYNGQTPIETLTTARKNDPSLKVLSFYGTQDDSIPKEDRIKTHEELHNAGINYENKEYNAGHAYFQKGRPNYNKDAAVSSLQDLQNLLS